MNDPTSGATEEYSRARRDDRAAREASAGPAGALFFGLLAAAAAGAIALAVAEFMPILHVKVLTAVVDEQTGGDRHSYGLLLLATLALLMAYGAARNRSRPAMAALAVLGLIAAAIAILGDAPDVNDVGSYGERYDQAAASAQLGFYLETLGAALLLFAGGALLVLTAPAAARSR